MPWSKLLNETHDLLFAVDVGVKALGKKVIEAGQPAIVRPPVPSCFISSVKQIARPVAGRFVKTTEVTFALSNSVLKLSVFRSIVTTPDAIDSAETRSVGEIRRLLPSKSKSAVGVNA